MIRKRKLSALNEDQLDTLEDLLTFLKKLRVFQDYYVNSKRYYDTVTTFTKNSAVSQWANLYDVEGIVVVDGHLDSDVPV